MTTNRSAIVWDGGLTCLCASRIAEAAADGADASNFIVALLAPPGVSLDGSDPSADASGPQQYPSTDSISAQCDAEIVHEVVGPALWAAGVASEHDAADAGAPGDRPPRRLVLARLMLAAAAAALEHDCRRVVWPAICGGDLRRLHTITQTAAAVNALVAASAPAGRESDGPTVVVETPFADLRDADLEALADDLGVVRELAASRAGGAGPLRTEPEQG